jgi:hypothetical protein
LKTLFKLINKMFNSINNKLINISNGKPNQRTPLILLNNELNKKKSWKRKEKSKTWSLVRSEYTENTSKFCILLIELKYI